MTLIDAARPLALDAAAYLDISHPVRLRPELKITVAERAWHPPVEDRARDWVSSIVAPALKILRARRGEAACKAFCALGTGVGLDALAAIELLGAEVIGLTDLFPDVVEAAADNVRANLAPGSQVAVHAGAGDLLQPLRASGVKFDLIYENLPNLPLAEGAQVDVESTSATFLAPRGEPIPRAARDALLAMHHVALVQAHDLLRPGGAVLATIGARVPLSAFVDMAAAAGHDARFLGYWWKAQVDPDEIVGSYALWQSQGFGPFHFYEVDVLEQTFGGLELEQAGHDALRIEAALRPHRLDAATALALHRRGKRIGHTVAVQLSEPKR